MTNNYRRYINSCFMLLLCCILTTEADQSEGRKLFGGYKITPRFCKPSRDIDLKSPGPNICMFNHECATRRGLVVGACMDGFLFGACCHLPGGSAGELVDSDLQQATLISNNLDAQIKTTNGPIVDVISNGISHMSSTVEDNASITTAQDNEVIQINGRPEDFGSTTGVTHSTAETMLLNSENNEIDPSNFQIPGLNNRFGQTTDRSSTTRYEEVTMSYGSSPSFIDVIAQSPYLTSSQGYQKPIFRPRPTNRPNEDKYVLVPTIAHPIKPNKTQELASIVNIINMLNDTSTVIPFLSSSKPSTIYMQQTNTKKPSSSKSTTRRPPSTSFVVTTPQKQYSTVTETISSRKPPSTSYIFSTTIPPRRTTTPLKKPSTSTSTKKPNTNKKPTYTIISSTRPTTNKPTTIKYSSVTKPGTITATKRPTKPSTSYVTGPTTKRPTTLNTHIVGPSFTIASPTKDSFSSSYPDSSYSSSSYPPPTVIVLSPVTSELPSSLPPVDFATTSPKPKPVTQLTINNIVTANNNYHFSTSERPPPTVLITPKPSVNIITGGSHRPVIVTTEFTTAAELEIETNSYDLNNFPPVRNPNLNMSASVASSEDELDFTTPSFIEDQILDKKVESFVNKIVESLQDPFNELKDVVYNKNKTVISTTRKPTTKKPATTKKPLRISSPKPATTRPTSRPTKRTTKRPTAVTSRKTTTTPTTTTFITRKTKPTKRITTTQLPQEDIEYDDENATEEELDYRKNCGIRPLMKSGRIVGGKGSTFGEWPWQVLVRESTWLGLFTKNKCGGVLISNKYVITAAHCQPGFLASLVAVFGEYDISGELESKRAMSKNVRRVIVHRQYDAGTFENDLALLELESPVSYDQHIVPICLPRNEEDFTGRMATVTGWGRLKYGGGVPSVLQEVKVPIMENHVCQEMFRTAGHSKIILDSFLCAGYANGQKDSCEGDSGGPLVLQRPDGRWQLAGTVSHGIKCAAPYLPGVYMRTTYYKPWLESITGIH